MALPFSRYINRISKYTNKLSMTFLALLISVLILVKSLAESLESLLLFVWILFLILSFFFVLNGFLLVYVFNKEINHYKKQGKPIRGIQGFDELKDALYKSRFESIFITLASVLAFTLFLITSDIIEEGGLIDLGELGSTLSLTMVFIAISVMFLVEYPDDPSFTPGGLIGYYEPDVFPLVLDNLLNDVFVTYVDPATFLKVDEWSNTILELLKSDYESDEITSIRLERAREKVLLLAYLSYSNAEAFSEETIDRELQELFGEINITQFKQGLSSGLTWNEVQDIVKRIEKRAPEPFRLVDRIMVQLVDNYDSFVNKDIYFTVSAKSNQGSVTESTGMVVFFLNNTSRDDRSVFVRLETDEYSIHPARQELSLKLDKMTDPYPAEQPPLVGEGDDILSLLAKVLQVGDSIWFRIQPTGFGYRVVSIKANEEGSNFAFGKTFEMRFTKSISWYIKTFLPRLSALGSVALPVIRSAIAI
ncbi:MAG: hypothetical protein GPJ54_03515 [Candidatus Heimdallarchaeota archaeon]|nr:hypothetical protein [Candidatus Heimdallarchaeota archaeon]